MLRARSIRHQEYHILQVRGLGGGPMDTCSTRRRRYRSQINDQILNLPVENIGGSEAQHAASLILVAIDDTESRKDGRGFQHGHAIGITDQLGEIVINDGRRDEVGAAWEVDYCWGD